MENAEKLILSAGAGDLNAIVHHLQEGISANVQDCEGVTALQAASVNGQDDAVKLLLSNSAIVDLPNTYGWTPLMLAARNGHYTTLSILLKHRARVHIFNKFGLTPIAAATWSGQISVVKLLLEAGAVFDEAPVGKVGLSHCDLMPVMVASLLGHDTILQLLLEKGASVNQSSSITGWSPLMLAACNGHMQTVQILLQWGADLNVHDVCGKNVLDIALLRGHRDVKVLLESMAFSRTGRSSGKEAELLQAVWSGNVYQVKLILKEYKRGANTVDPVESISALMIASMLGYMDIVQSLVISGADVNAQDTRNGWTPLMHAVFYKKPDVVKYLLERGADISICASDGYSVLDLANYLDDSDKDIICALNSKIRASELNKPNGMCSAALLPVSTRKKSHSFGAGMSKKSPQVSRLKGWIGGMAGRFQTVLPKPSTKSCSSTAAIPSISVAMAPVSAADADDDVFDKSTSSVTSMPSKARLNMSALKSPERYLAPNLRKHSLGAVTPPILGTPSRSIRSKDIFSCRKLSLTQQPKQNRAVSLKTPNLLKNYTKKSLTTNQGKDQVQNDISKPHLNVNDQEIRFRDQFHKPPELQLTTYSDLYSPQHSTDLVISSPKQNENAVNSSSFKSTLGGLSEILKSESLQKHIKKFKDQEVDLEAFKCLTEDDLDEIGIETNLSRVKLLEIINNLNVCDLNQG